MINEKKPSDLIFQFSTRQKIFFQFISDYILYRLGRT